MNGEVAIPQAPMPRWPAKFLTVVIMAVGAVLLYVDGVVAASLTQTNVGFTKATPIAYLVAALGIPIGVALRSRRSQGSTWTATRRAALVRSR